MKVAQILMGLAIALSTGIGPINTAYAANDQYNIKLKFRSFTPPASTTLPEPLLQNGDKQRLLLQFYEAPSASQLRALNITPLHYVSPVTIAASVAGPIPDILRPAIRWIGSLQANDKFSASVQTQFNTDSREQFTLLVEAFPDLSPEELSSLTSSAGGISINHPSLPDHIQMVTGNQAVFQHLAQQSNITWMSLPGTRLLAGEPVDFCIGAQTEFGSVASYTTMMPSWGWDGPGLGSAIIPYAFTNGTSDIAGSLEFEIVQNALTEWAKYANINFVRINKLREPGAIDIGWYSGAHGDTKRFDGYGEQLAHGFFPNPPNADPIAGDIHFDEDENWSVNGEWWNASEKDLFTVAMHEAGHALGVDHSDIAGAIMAPYYEGPATGLRADDIAAIQSLYSARQPTPFLIKRANTNSQKTEIYSLSDQDSLQTLISTNPTLLPESGTDGSYAFEVSNYNSDAMFDLFVIKKTLTAKNKTHLTILSGADNYQAKLLDTPLPLAETGSDYSYDFALGFFNSDTYPDLFVIQKNATSSKSSEVLIYDGKQSYQNLLFRSDTILPETGSDTRFEFEVGDANFDGIPDIYMIDRSADGQGPVQIAILDGAKAYKAYIQTATDISFQQAGLTNQTQFEIGHFDNDGRLDLYILQTNGTSSGFMELTVLNGMDQFQTVIASNITALAQSSSDEGWTFRLAIKNSIPNAGASGCGFGLALQRDPSLPLLAIGSIVALLYRKRSRPQ